MQIKTHFRVILRLCTWPSFEKEAKDNSEMAYLIWIQKATVIFLKGGLDGAMFAYDCRMRLL